MSKRERFFGILQWLFEGFFEVDEEFFTVILEQICAKMNDQRPISKDEIISERVVAMESSNVAK